ncbi:Hypothetical predicted protein [Mytilus galloprovincialis]|uniref:Pleiotrophin/Midkine C-terminal domain-containing protein n=1 Tax=Mytilus galloprovincialis TaxID=29158 RepID=A0A8B6G1C3_MYTGA|nr:Hypothetical predicted protein [Mytilus galloprovincialis]
MKNVFVIFVVVLVATAAAKKGWKLRQRQQCKYDKSAWSDCDTKTNTVSRVLTLKSGKEGCQQTQNQTITCDRFERLQAWKIKKAESRRELQEKKHQRKERQQEMKENKQLVKEQLERCRYEHSDWSECDQATKTVTRNFTLSEGEQGCEQSHTITIACDKLNRIQAWKAKKRDRKQNRIDEKLQMKQDRKEKRKLEKEQRLKCKYDKEDWSECDNTTKHSNPSYDIKGWRRRRMRTNNKCHHFMFKV